MSTATLDGARAAAGFPALAADEAAEFMLEVPPGQVVQYDLAKLCSALGVTDPGCIAVEAHGRHAIVTVYGSNPLAEIRAVTAEDLVMDRQGRITVGRYHNGRPVKRRLFDPASGSAQRFLLFGTTGAGKSRTLQMELIAEKLNGIVSWVCDLKHGQSVPEARDNVDWFGDTPELAILMLLAGVAVAQERMARYSAMGRTAFLLGRPDPLLHLRVEEANRLLEKGSLYRDLATYLIRELGRTGRSVGVGEGLSAQASHLEELGGSDTLRAMLKEGEVTLLRWSSSMMRQLVSDGLLAASAQLMPIPKTLKPTRLVSQFEEYVDEDEDASGTQGMAYVLSGPAPTSLMRHFRIGSIAPLPGLDPEILALYGPGEPAHLEPASWGAAGEAYEQRHDPTALQALCADLQERAERGRLDPATIAGAPVTATTIPVTSTGTGTSASGGAALLEDRLLAALEHADDPMSAPDLLEAINTDGGRLIKLGSVRNELIKLANNGQVERADHGLYTLPT